MTTLSGAAATDVGRVRQINEDRYLVGDGLYAVADGVGGHQAGEVASQTSVEALAEHFVERTADGLVDAIEEANAAVWRLAQEQSDRRGMGTTITALALVDEDGEEQIAIANVGDSRAYLFQRGDLVQITEDHSLVEELVRSGQLTPEEAQVHPQRSIITRALGMEPEIRVDSWTITPYAGDRLVLCSDGLTNEVSVDRIAATLRQLADPQEAARDLVRQARTHGGNDNITVVVVDVLDDGGKAEAAPEALAGERDGHGDEDDEGADGETRTARTGPPPRAAKGGDLTGALLSGGLGGGLGAGGLGGGLSGGGSGGGGWPPAANGVAGTAPPSTGVATRPAPSSDAFRVEPDRPRRFTWRVALFLGILVTVLAVGTLAVGWYARSAYFVGIDKGTVAVFQGRSGGILWFKPTVIERAEDLTADKVPPGATDELRAGKEEASKAEADRYLQNLRDQVAAITASTTTIPPAVTSTTAPATTTTSTTRP